MSTASPPPAAPGPHLPRGPFSGWTLRRRLVVSILTLFAVVTLLTSLVTTTLVEQSLQRELDARVMSTAARAVGPDRDGERDHRPPGRQLTDGLVLAADSGTVTVNQVGVPGGGTTSLSAQQASALLAAGLDGRPRTVDLGTLGRYRLVEVTTPDGRRVVSGVSMRPLEDSLARIRTVTIGLALLGLGLIALGIPWLVRVNVRPLEHVAATAGRVSTLPLSSGEVSLTERVPAQHTDRRTEVGQVGAALNDLLDHVDAALQARHDSEQQLRRFVADASHELRTPLASLRGYAELSRRETDPVPDGVRHALGLIESEAGRMSSLVEDLLILARLDAGRPLERTRVDLTMLLLDTVGDARAAGPDHRWRLDLPDEPVEVVGDPARLTQVVVNLLANARVHTPAGTTVTTRLRPDVDRVALEVEDDGPGIPGDLLPTVFARFTRADDARVRGQGSTGLGLSIADAVVVAHGGTIGVESAPGRTVFRVALPAPGPQAG